MAKKNIYRKCQFCDEVGKKTINLEKEKYIIETKNKINKFWHFECYVKKISKKNKISINDARKYVENIYNKQKDLTLSKHQLINYLLEHHDVNSLSTFVYKRLDEIYAGVYKDMKEGISYEDLLTMYKKQITKLDETAIYKKKHGNGFTNVNNQILYNLAILVNKYDSFKKWKLKNKLLAEQNFNEKHDMQKQKIEYVNIQKTNKNNFSNKNKNNDNEVDLEELF